MKISKRLLKCASHVPPYRKVADVGTDHALLPIYLIEEGIADKVIASDVRLGPIDVAKKNVIESNHIDKIKVVLSDGIKHLTEEVDCLIISGMGGKLISDILNNDNLKNITRLILQPNMASNILRKFLQDNGFKIIDEEMIVDNKLFYEIIISERGKMDLTEKELIFGPVLLNNKNDEFIKYWENELRKLDTILESVPESHENYPKLKKQYSLIKEVLNVPN